MHLDGKGVIQIEEILEIRAIAPPLVYRACSVCRLGHAAPDSSKEGGKIYDFIAYFFVGVNAEWPVRKT